MVVLGGVRGCIRLCFRVRCALVYTAVFSRALCTRVVLLQDGEAMGGSAGVTATARWPWWHRENARWWCLFYLVVYGCVYEGVVHSGCGRTGRGRDGRQCGGDSDDTMAMVA